MVKSVREYPIVKAEMNGFLVLSIHDLSIIRSIELPKNSKESFSNEFIFKVAALEREMYREVGRKIVQMRSQGLKLPPPSLLKKSVSSKKSGTVATEKKDYSPLDLVEILGLSKNTIRSMIDRGEVKAKKTAGGHRRVSKDEIKRLMDLE